jgi:ribosomal protein S6E (S10)
MNRRARRTKQEEEMTMNAKSVLHAELGRAFPGVEFDTQIDYKREEITIGWRGGPEKAAVHARIGTAPRWQLVLHRRPA